MAKSLTQQFDDLNNQAYELSQLIPVKTNKWNEWIIEQTKKNLQEIQRLHQLPFNEENINNAFNQLQTMLKNINDAYANANRKIDILSFEQWKKQQAQQSFKSASLMNPDLSKEKYEDYKKDLDQGKHYHAEELAVATSLKKAIAFKEMEKQLTKFNLSTEKMPDSLSKSPLKKDWQHEASEKILNQEAPKLFSDLIREITLIKIKLEGNVTTETQSLFSAQKANPLYLKALNNLLSKIKQLKKADTFINAKSLSLALKEVANTRDDIYQSSQGESNPVYQALIAIRGNEKYAKFKQLHMTNEDSQKNTLKK